MTPRRMLLAAAGALTGLVIALGLLAFPPGSRGAEGAARLLLPAPIPATDFELTGHDGAPRRLLALGEGRLLAVFFGYTSCPDVCPLTMANLGRALGQLGEDAGRVQVVMVTVDPARDTPARLAEYLAPFPGGMIGLTGPAETLAAATTAYLSYAAPYAAPAPHGAPAPAASPALEGHDHGGAAAASPERYLVDHSGRTLIVQDDAIVMTFAPGTTAPEMAEGLELLLER